MNVIYSFRCSAVFLFAGLFRHYFEEDAVVQLLSHISSSELVTRLAVK